MLCTFYTEYIYFNFYTEAFITYLALTILRVIAVRILITHMRLILIFLSLKINNF